MMTAVVLHLSDIHIKTQHDPILKRADEIASTLFSSLPAATHVFIVISGDIAYSGTEEQYSYAKDFLEKLRSTIRKEAPCPVNFIICPGNHDCDFSVANGARKLLVDMLEKQENPEVDESVINLCTQVQDNFFKFRESLESCSGISDDKLWRTSRFEVEGKVIEFDSLNISWVSKIKEEPGKLYFPVGRYANNTVDTADLRFVVMHHPINWFSQGVYRPFRTFIRKISNIVISGHEHQGNVGLITDAETDTSAFVEGCVLQADGKDLTDSSFNLVVLDLVLAQFASTKYIWDGNKYAVDEEGSWTDYHDLPEKQSNPFAILPEFEEMIEDPGAYFKHPGRANVGLSDIYVFPDLRKVGNGDDRRRIYVSSSRLLVPEVTEDGVLIQGEEKHGCTSLLYQLFRQYHDRGYVPVLLKGKELKKTGSDLDNLILKSVERQYGKTQVGLFTQSSRTQKLALIDDFDDSPIKSPNVRAEILCQLKQRFAHLVVSVGDMFEMREMLEGDSSHSLAALAHYKIQPFGHVLRGQLINRWLSLGSDATVDEAELLARLDQAEKLMNTVMQKSVIPSVPLYLLTLLQSIDAGRSGDFKESALGYYYQYLLTEAFQSAGVKPDKLTKFFQFSAYLAWEYQSRKKRELSELEIKEFTQKFSTEWTTVEFSSMIDVLIKSRVLSKVGDDYSFRYPYIYYYLKGQYLSENLSQTEVKTYITHCCKHLYVRDHANTVLFLAHHTNDDFVLQSIADTLHNLFKDKKPVRFDGDTLVVNQLIENAPQLVYSGEKPAEHRARRNKFEDDIDDGSDGLLESEEESDDLSLIAKVTTLLKTTEILGQVLKNQYSKIKRERKSELLEELFNGPLRAIRDFYQFFEKNPEALVAEIETAILKKAKSKLHTDEERKKIAKKVVAGVIQVVTYGFLLRAGQQANSEDLLEDVHAVVTKINTSAFKIIEASILLDSSRPIPRSFLRTLYSQLEKDLIARRIIQMMVLNRLYMFKTSERDMQWLSNELKIDLDMQHAITYQDKSRRLAK